MEKNKITLAIASFVLLAWNALATSVVPPQPIIAPQEALWFAVNDSNIVAVLENGRVGVWNYSGELQHQFKAPKGGRWALSRTQPPLLVNAREEDIGGQTNDTFYSKLITYDLRGNEKSRARFELLSPSTCVFAGTTPAVIMTSPPVDSSLVAVDVWTRREIWRVGKDAEIGSEIVVLDAGQCSVNFCNHELLRARNSKGRLLWRWKCPRNKMAEPAYWPENPAAPYLVVYESNMEKDEIADYVALSAKTGRSVWRLKNVKYDSLKAVSNDGRQQFYFERGHAEITDLPQTNRMEIAAVKDEPDAVFSPDGKFLFCLPKLDAGPTSAKDNTYAESRKSNLMQVVSVETGRIVTQFNLAPATEK